MVRVRRKATNYQLIKRLREWQNPSFIKHLRKLENVRFNDPKITETKT